MLINLDAFTPKLDLILRFFINVNKEVLYIDRKYLSIFSPACQVNRYTYMSLR